MKLSVIIAYYKNIPGLDLILKALAQQSYRNFEVIIAEDDNEPITKDFYVQQLVKYSFEIKHVQQDADRGFRKNEILNKAIAISNGAGIVFLDGDCIPHRHLLSTYAKSLKPSVILFGRRVMLSRKFSKKLLGNKNLASINFLQLLINGCSQLKYSIYIPNLKVKKQLGVWGCNWGILKKHLVEINGFDENYQQAGVGEDVDIEKRLLHNGLKLYAIKNSAIVYHLFHKANYSDSVVKENVEYMKSKDLSKEMVCKNGLDKYLNNQIRLNNLIPSNNKYLNVVK